MSSLVKKSFQLGKAVYATVNEEFKNQTQKPAQHPPQGYYPPAQIPGTYGAQSQVPPLPPRPATNDPGPHGYEPPAGYGPPHGLQQNGHAPVTASPYGQTNYALPTGPVYSQNGYMPPYGAHPPPSPAISQSSPVHGGAQMNGTISSAPSTAGAQSQWTPVSPLPTTASPFVPPGPYSPPTPSNAPTQAFPPTQSAPPHAYEQSYMSQNAVHRPSPPLSPPLNSPPITQSYGPPHFGAPVSPAMPPATVYSDYPPSHAHSPEPGPPSGYASYSTPPSHPSPPLHVLSPTSPVSAPPSQMPHPPAFVSELPAFSEPRPPVAFSLPEGVAELPAESSTGSASKPSPDLAPTHGSPGATPPTIPSTAVTPSSAVEQPKPMHPPHQQQEPAPHQAAYAPAPYAPAPTTANTQPPPTTSYQPYHPSQSAPNPEHSTPAPSSTTQTGYMPYTPPSAQYGAQYQAQPQMSPQAQQPGIPQRMGSLANKIQQMNISHPQSQYPYQATMPLDPTTPQGPAVGKQGVVGTYVPSASPPPFGH